jgi:hypothetical protein
VLDIMLANEPFNLGGALIHLVVEQPRVLDGNASGRDGGGVMNRPPAAQCSSGDPIGV